MPKVSVIVPIYNVEKYINQCIDSLINQTLQDIEIILVDDGSPDNCGKICDDYAKKDNRIVVVHKKNGGVSAARNDGINMAKGKFLMFVDADDWCDEKMCEIAYNTISEEKVELALFNYFSNFEKKETNNEIKAPKDFFFNESKDIDKLQLTVIAATYSKLIEKNTFVTGFTAPWSKIFSKDFIVKNNIRFNVNVGGLFDDGLFILDCLQYAKNVCFKNIALYHYRILTTSITKIYNPNKLKKYNPVYIEIQKFINKFNKSEEFTNAYYCRVITYLSGSLDTCFFNKLNKDSYFKTAKRLKETINSEVYKDAINNVKFEFLTKKQKVYTILFKINNIFLIYTTSKIVVLIKKILKMS